MSNIKIETLTPVHIGSGNLLYENLDFIQVNIKKVPHLVIISEEKVWKILDEQHLDNWLEAISKRENFSLFLEKFAPNVKSSDYAKRRIPFSCKPSNYADVLKECIHNSIGLPYIPGSSIKGAIRTAILASLTNTIKGKEEKIDLRKYKDDSPTNRNITADNIERELFANNAPQKSYPNADVFRFIQVGDAYFEKETEIVVRLINLNFRHGKDNLLDTSNSQIVEAIRTEKKSEFQLKVSKEYYDFVKKKYPQTGNLPVSSIGDLFRLINEHTKKLVEDEVNYWINTDKTGGDNYVCEMQKILKEINSCVTGKSCVLRIGHASGWRFITGAWTETLQNFKEIIVPASRPNNRNYEDYDFPKTRRLGEDSYILGFVKLSI